MFKRYFITGLLIWLPIGITVWVLGFVVNTLDNVVPIALSPQALFGRDIPGFGVLVVALVVFLTGLLAANLLGSSCGWALGVAPCPNPLGALHLLLCQAGE